MTPPTTQPLPDAVPPVAVPAAVPVESESATATTPAAPVPVLSYVTPAAAAAQGAWREGKVLVVAKNWVLPPTCVKCDAPAEGAALKRNFYWHHWALYLLILLPYGLLIYIIVALVARKRGTVYLGLCQTHRRRRWLLGSGGGLLAVAGIPTFLYGAIAEEPLWMIVGGVGFIAGLVMLFVGQTLRARRIDAHYLWLKGASPRFLDRFPGTAGSA